MVLMRGKDFFSNLIIQFNFQILFASWHQTKVGQTNKKNSWINEMSTETKEKQ